MRSIHVAFWILLGTSMAGSAYSWEQRALSDIPLVAQAEQTSPPTPPPHPTRLSYPSDMPRPIHKVQPVCPADLKATGTVILDAIIDDEGSVMTVETVSGNPILAKAAIDAVKQWRYKPFLVNNQAVQIETKINVVFKLNEKGNLKPQPKKP
jgi:TonB family protein